MKEALLEPPDPVRREINPQFKSRLPAILEQVCTCLLSIEPEMRQLGIQLKEFAEYLDFEIEKVRLEIEKSEWKDRVDRAKLDDDREWLAKLRALRAEFDIDLMTSPVTLIRSMVERVQDLFGKVSQE
ncbi:hypothetical protein [Bradyrhizobium sp. SZCCHNRI2010]|uniref:hypothetical protein n=1 Tax=Bradyrhizobium sp. SZCCHNRI2010 TaxID=3057283 RepID=UPI0028E2D07F|nr:hypothetical protein [Bradyrhizobium sp. SZCCHNRI2010]